MLTFEAVGKWRLVLLLLFPGEVEQEEEVLLVEGERERENAVCSRAGGGTEGEEGGGNDDGEEGEEEGGRDVGRYGGRGVGLEELPLGHEYVNLLGQKLVEAIRVPPQPAEHELEPPAHSARPQEHRGRVN